METYLNYKGFEKGVYHYQGEIAIGESLPEHPDLGDTYKNLNTGKMITYTISGWQDMAPGYVFDPVKNSICLRLSSDNEKNLIEIADDGKVYITDVGGYDGTNPDSSSSLQEILDTLSSNTQEIDNKIVNFIIPNYESDTEPSDPALGEYWWDTTDNIIYIYKKVKTDDPEPQEVEQFVECDLSVKFIDSGLLKIYEYDNVTEKWIGQDGENGYIYLSSNTNDFLRWSEEDQKFVEYNSADPYLNAVHFVDIYEVFNFTDPVVAPTAEECRNRVFILRETENESGIYQLYQAYQPKSTTEHPDPSSEWAAVTAPVYAFAIDRDSVVIYANNSHESSANTFATYSEGFSEDIFYIDDNSGDVYSYAEGYGLQLLSGEDLSKILPKSYLIDCDTTHVVLHTSPRNTVQQTYSLTESLDDSAIQGVKINGLYTINVVNHETGVTTKFTLEVTSDVSRIYQKLYNDDITYTRYIENNDETKHWSSWKASFKKAYAFELLNYFNNHIQVLVKADKESIYIHEPFIYVNFYRKRSNHGRNKWHIMGAYFTDDHNNSVWGGDVSLDACDRAYNTYYDIPLNVREYMNNMIRVTGGEKEDLSNPTLVDVMRYGCGTELSDLHAYRKGKGTTSSFCTYGYRDGYNIAGVTPSISMPVGVNITYGDLQTMIFPYRFKIRGRINQGDEVISYTVSPLFTNSVNR